MSKIETHSEDKFRVIIFSSETQESQLKCVSLTKNNRYVWSMSRRCCSHGNWTCQWQTYMYIIAQRYTCTAHNMNLIWELTKKLNVLRHRGRNMRF